VIWNGAPLFPRMVLVGLSLFAVVAVNGLAVAAAAPQESGVPENKSQPPAAKKKDVPVETDDSSGAVNDSHRGIKDLGKDFLGDQKHIWTSPARLRFADADWIVPASGLAAGLFVTDSEVSRHISVNPSTISHYNSLSTAGIGALVGGAAGLWVLSYPAHNEHWRETGFLAGEAAVNSLITVEALKYSLRRQRPFQGDGTGPFFQSGGTSFPSEHSAAAWSVAGVIAHEYPGLLPRIMVYGLASLVSYSRIRGRQHFPSDVFIGGVIGQFIAQDVYTRHHDPELGGAEWRSIGNIVRGDGYLSSANRGSPYVPLDSWIYPALDRLTALGLIDSSFAGMRPWTRMECARLLNEAIDESGYDSEEHSAPGDLINALQREFRPKNEESEEHNGAFRLESLYSRVEYISGTPLHDGYNFAQTQVDDFGRPFGQGWSTVTGLSAYATQGRWVAYLRGELQTAPQVPALSLAARQTVEAVDGLAETPPDTIQPATHNLKLLDAYVGLVFSNWQVTFGRQSLQWGPGVGSPLMFSDSAAPLDMFRINRVSPLELPSIFGWLGPMRVELFLGQLRGQHFIFGQNTGLTGSFTSNYSPQPMIHGERFTFKPTKNFEFGFSRTGLFAGSGVPFTLHTLEKSFFGSGNGLPGTAGDPGDRRSGLDWSYRLPRLRDWITFYGDAFTDDQFSPIAYPDRSAIRGGLFLSHFPGLAKLDFRVEGVYTDVPAGGRLSHGFFYSNDRYRGGYTSDGYLLGSWIGREGQGAQAWTNYWFSPRTRLQANYRHEKVSQQFIPGGGTLTDVGARGDFQVRSNVTFSASVQYEKWLIPVIQPTAQTDVSATVEISFQPQKLFRHSSPAADVRTGELP
jgi:membrane-associated phospholipid phosphatase